ncbi:M16 family metallopeptidase [Acetobacteroides hydrogenigenes]|uniref:Putative Zn-dependent peptidase n=1 Tax=Acetobacteroides hydrogenigenes TaxID=979970 RepID=A0A4R2EHY5_9BACT|nr:pitrilysin family protein [Acetobacteroides hydrogenigenes]TCN67697.1 putative Zn-dependent peptidase [Acetobacteroides hydrogenigenes]
MVNRAIQPEFSLPSTIEIPSPQKHLTADKREVLWLKIGTQDIVRITLQFPAGTKYQQKMLQASSTIGLLSDGTKSYSAQELAEKLDFYGSHIDYSIDRDHAVISAFCLEKYLYQTLELLKEIVIYPAFDADEFETYRQKRKTTMAIEKAKVMYQAREQFAATLYGKDHPYGSFAEPEDYDALSADDLKAFHRERYLEQGALIFVSGMVNEDVVANVAREFDAVIRRNATDTPIVNLSDLPVPHKIYFQKDDAVQSAVRMGRVLFARNHPDYSGMQVLATIFGGYFGSRLMSNIREEKGYTYGIFSSLVSMQESGYLTISTEVGSEVTSATIEEVVKEMERLRTEKVGEEELSLVVNYMVGEMLRMLDGPFSIVDAILELYQSGLPVNFISRHFERVKSITSEELLELAQKYLDPKDYSEIVVGNR